MSACYPLDNEFAAIPPGERLSRLIFAGNIDMIRAADAVVANLTPFRGSGADPGTVFEVGYAHALGKPVYGYSADQRTLLERIAAGEAAALRQAADGRSFAGDGLAVEDFGLFDNLMIAEALAGFQSGATTAPGLANWSDLALFTATVAAIGQSRLAL